MTPIIIVSDSLALPRLEPEVVLIQQTYPSLLNQHFGGVINCAYGASTSNNVLSQAGYLKGISPGAIYILNFGIVDCTPRILTRRESLLLRKLGIRLPDNLSKWLRLHRTVRKTTPNAFRKNCRALKALSLGELLVLPIAPASDAFETEVPGVQASVALYNDILSEEFGKAFCSVNFDYRIHIMSDHHHLTVQGHFQVFCAIKSRIEKLLQYRSEMGV